MAGLEGDAIGGFNSLIEEQKQREGRSKVPPPSANWSAPSRAGNRGADPEGSSAMELIRLRKEYDSATPRGT